MISEEQDNHHVFQYFFILQHPCSLCYPLFLFIYFFLPQLLLLTFSSMPVWFWKPLLVQHQWHAQNMPTTHGTHPKMYPTSEMRTVCVSPCIQMWRVTFVFSVSNSKTISNQKIVTKWSEKSFKTWTCDSLTGTVWILRPSSVIKLVKLKFTNVHGYAFCIWRVSLALCVLAFPHSL